MRAPLSWLRDFAPFEEDPSDIAAVLDDLGLVVEGVERIGEGLDRVVVAKVVEIAPIRGADKIRKVTVEAGGEASEVVCGAWNFEIGDLVPLATVGVTLPNGIEIGRRTMRGVVSNGMLCSGKELGLSEDGQGLMVLGRDRSGDPATAAEPGMPLADALGIERDVVFDIAVETNRPDAWSIAGIARDLAARLKLPFEIPDPVVPSEGASAGELATVEVVDRDLCPRFTARALTGVRVAPSPPWLVRRLVMAGMRALSNVVDASNYVMLELGQPTHPYDLDRVGGGGLIVRAARQGETLATLDGVERRFGQRSTGPLDDRRDCLICDAHDVPIGIGGVMGGASTEIDEKTSRVLLEAAYFAPMAIARTSKRLALRTEASARFERGCDPEGIDRAAVRFCELLGITGGSSMKLSEGVIDVRGEVPAGARLTVRTEKVSSLLGRRFEDSEVAGYLRPIGFSVEVVRAGVLDVTVPTFRPDTEREADVAEEIARHHGYSNLPRRTPRPPQVGRLSYYQRERRRLRHALASLGAHEAWTSSLIAPGDHSRAGIAGDVIEVSNPLVSEESVLRRSLLPGLLSALAFNLGRREGDLRLFEVGNVFPPPDSARVKRALARETTVVDEREAAGLLLARRADDARVAMAAWRALESSVGLEGIRLEQDAGFSPPGLHPTRSGWLRGPAEGTGDGELVYGVAGEVDPAVLAAFGLDPASRVGWVEVDLGLLLGSAGRRSELLAPVSKFPASEVDLAFAVPDDVPASAVLATLQASAGPLGESITLFDVYRGKGLPEGRRSLAFRLRFRAPDRTLTDSEVGEVRISCIEAVERAHGAELRG
jgi:phenylalanyl-tRNA synthetase beta chain